MSERVPARETRSDRDAPRTPRQIAPVSRPALGLPPGLRTRLYTAALDVRTTFGRDLSDVRLITGAGPALGATAATDGRTIVTASANPDRRVLAHELAHAVQFRNAPPTTNRLVGRRHDVAEREAERVADVVARGGTPGPIIEAPSARVHLDDTEPVCRPPNVGTFVLDPAIAGVSSPPRMTTHIRVAQPVGLGRGLFLDRFVALERPVRSATRILVFAVPYDQVSTQPITSSQGTPTCSTTVFHAGQRAYTASGPICITQVAYPLVFIDAQSPDTAAAGAVIVAETDTGNVLIDGGLQLTDPSYAAALGAELGRRVSEHTGGNPVAEAIMAPVGRDGAALPHIATQIGIRSIRATADQQQDGTVARIIEAQSRYRTWFERSLRERLAGQRSEWESTQPIAPNNSVRDRLWEAHVDAEVATAMREHPPPTVGALVTTGNVVQASGPAATVELAPGEVPDLSSTRWERAPAQSVFLVGGGRIVLSRAVMLRPVTAGAEPPAAMAPARPAAPPVPTASVLPQGETGLAPAVPRPVNPWTLLPAVGKEGHIFVRLEGTHGFLVDAGGSPNVITVAESARMSAALGGVTVEAILPTHSHTDHVRMLLDLIRRHNVPARNVVVSASDTDVIDAMRRITDPALTTEAMGYGSRYAPTVAVESSATPVSHTRVRIGSSHVDVYALRDAHRQLRQDVARERAGGPAVPSERYDSAGFVYTFGNDTSPNRALVLGDYRGEDIMALHDALGAEGFRSAMRNVRTVFGVGHHFSRTAGRTPADVRGMELLVEATLLQNGELTIQIQSNEAFAFEGTSGRELLRYFNRQGVRIVFADRAGDARTRTPSGALTDTAGNVSTYGTQTRIFPGDPRVVAMHRRLDMLREARRTVADSPQFGPAALQMEGRSAADIIAGLDAEIGRLVGLARELRGYAGADLLDVRGPEGERGTSPPRVAERTAYRDTNTTAGRTADQIVTDMAVQGTMEQALSPTVRERLQLAVQSGRSLALDVEFRAVPREVTAAMESLPQETRQKLAAKYRELTELVGRLRSDVIPPAELLESLAHVTALRTELASALAHLPDTEANRAARATFQQELTRIDEVTRRIRSNTESEVHVGRDLNGNNTRTEYIRANAAIMRGFHGIGRGLGAMMVLHSVQGAGAVARDAASGNATIPEAALRLAHSAYGLSIGFRMARQTFTQAAAGTGGVAAWEFAILAVIEVGAAAAAHYGSPEERNAAILGTALHASVNLLCMQASMWLMGAAAAIPHPYARLAAMGLAFAVAFAGEPILRAVGADEAVQRWTGFPPGSVTEVQQRIDRTLSEYRVMIGAQMLQARSDESLTGIGLTPTTVRRLAPQTADSAAVSVRAKERELTGLFETAYRDSQGAHFGLEYLDQQAAEFTRLRAMALGDRQDPNRAELDRRWREMDQRLDLSSATDAVIEGMPQWGELDTRLTTLGEKLRANPVVYEEAFEAMEKVQLVLDNARYRLDSPTRGGLRPRALITSSSPAHRRYTALLNVRETRMATLYGELMRASGSPSVTLDDVSLDAPTALTRFRTIRSQYDAKVTALSNLHPELAHQQSWATPGQMATVVVAANRLHRARFEQLRMTELALEAAARQLDAAMRGAESRSPTEAIRRTVRAEIDDVPAAIRRRRMTLGLVFAHELDAVIEQRSAVSDRVFAAQIDAAFPAGGVRRTAPVQPLADAELEALHSTALGTVYGSTTTTEARLAQERAILAPMRTFTIGVDRFSLSRADYDLLARARRQYIRLNSTYMIRDTWLFVETYPTRTVAPGRTCIVAMVPGEVHVGQAGGIFSGPMRYARVIAINPDAVAQLGNEPVYIRPLDLRVITPDEIARLAAQPPPP